MTKPINYDLQIRINLAAQKRNTVDERAALASDDLAAWAAAARRTLETWRVLDSLQARRAIYR